MTREEMVAEMERLRSRAESAEAALERARDQDNTLQWFMPGGAGSDGDCAYRGLIDNLDALILFIDTDEIIRSANGCACEFLGLERSELEGMPIRDLLNAIVIPGPQHDQTVKELLSDPTTKRVDEVDVIRPDGSNGCISWTRRPVRDADGELLGVVAVGTDVSARRDNERQSKVYQQALRSLTMKLALSEERQRRTIATRIHEEISQNLAYAKLRVGALKGCENGSCDVTIAEINELLDHAIAGTRALAFELSPPLLHELGFCEAVDWLTDQFEDQYDIRCEFAGNGDTKPIPHPISVTMFRAVGELLRNIARHSDADSAGVEIRQDDHKLRVLVSDDGRGFDAEDVLGRSGNSDGFGLFNIRERLDFLGGKMAIKSDPLTGTCVELVAPINGASDHSPDAASP